MIINKNYIGNKWSSDWLCMNYQNNGKKIAGKNFQDILEIYWVN